MDEPGQDHVQASSAVLSAASHYLYAACLAPFDQYMQCRSTSPPLACTALAEQVVRCANLHFCRLRQSPCQPFFRRLWRCLDNNDHVCFTPTYCLE